ncbi:MAG: hypothetical protein E6H79_00345 [Betaproteobacteria bacterium]|nr:MAG: hypothetical protein E6H79_00345 [Betaproteobacteria bacterium]
MTAATPRFDFYASIHKALRRFMCDTLLKLGALDVADASEMERTLDENDFVHTAIEARRPAGARQTANDHIEHLATIRALEEEMQALRALPAEQRMPAAHRLYRHLSLFVAENFEHMHEEETINNATLWSLYSDEELVALHDRLMASIPPREVMDTVHWLAPSLNPQELAALLGDFQTKTPPEPFRHVLDLVRGRLDQTSWAKLARALRVPPAPGLVGMA